VTDLVKVKTALISVSDKTDLLVLAAALKECGVQVIRPVFMKHRPLLAIAARPRAPCNGARLVCCSPRHGLRMPGCLLLLFLPARRRRQTRYLTFGTLAATYSCGAGWRLAGVVHWRHCQDPARCGLRCQGRGRSHRAPGDDGRARQDAAPKGARRSPLYPRQPHPRAGVRRSRHPAHRLGVREPLSLPGHRRQGRSVSRVR
jgi:hypothetical protein